MVLIPHFQFSVFQRVHIVTPSVEKLTLQEAADFFTPHFPLEVEKEDRKCLFSTALYKPKTTRKRENIEAMTGIVFDFDNKGKDFISIESVVIPLEQRHIIHFWYTTWSHTTECPRWRLIIPFAFEHPIATWEKVYDQFVVLIGDPPGIDHTASRDAAHMWYIPYKKPQSVFLASAMTEGLMVHPLDLESLLTSEEKEKIQKKQQRPSLDFKYTKETPTSPPRAAFTLQEIQEALKYISPECAYDRWIKIAMALHHHFNGSTAAFDLWDKWSSSSSKYPGCSTLANHWKSFKGKDKAVGLATLILFAKEGGYQPSKELEEEIVEVSDEETTFDFSDYENIDIYDFPSPLLREIYNFLLTLNPLKVPMYALGATIALTGFLLRNYVSGHRRCRPNFYILSIGASGSGKTCTREGVLDILQYVKQESFFEQRLGSYQGGVEALEKNGGSLFLLPDSASSEVKSVRNKNVTNAEMRTEELKTTLFSSPSCYRADATKEGKRTIIYNPFYAELSISTPDILKKFTPEDITKGLLPRYLFLTTNALFFEENIEEHDQEKIEIPYSKPFKDIQRRKNAHSSNCVFYRRSFSIF
jgi:Primase C terminal 2 (PriCT-2)